MAVIMKTFRSKLVQCFANTVEGSRKSLLHSEKRRITKTCLYNFDPLKPHFYIVKLGFTGVYIIFLISAQKHRLWVFVRWFVEAVLTSINNVCFSSLNKSDILYLKKKSLFGGKMFYIFE